MSLIEVSDYQSCKLLELKKLFCLKSPLNNPSLKITPQPTNETIILYRQQKLVIVIDLTPSIYSYHSDLQDIIYNFIPHILRNLIKGLYSVDLSLEISILCTRMAQAPLHVIVQSYTIDKDEDYYELLSFIKYSLNELNSGYNYSKEETKNIKFNTVLK